MAVAWIEVLVGVAGQIAQSLDLILNRMGVDNVHSGVPKRELAAKKELT